MLVELIKHVRIMWFQWYIYTFKKNYTIAGVWTDERNKELIFKNFVRLTYCVSAWNYNTISEKW